MMEIQELGSIGELIAGVATLITLIYLATQIRQNTQVVRSTNYMNLSSQVNEFARTVANDAELNELYVRGTADFDSLSEAEKNRFNMMFSVLIHPYQSMFMVRGAGHVDVTMMARDMEVMTSLFSLPGVQQWWAQNKAWWHPPFTEFLDEAVKRSA